MSTLPLKRDLQDRGIRCESGLIHIRSYFEGASLGSEIWRSASRDRGLTDTDLVEGGMLLISNCSDCLRGGRTGVILHGHLAEPSGESVSLDVS